MGISKPPPCLMTMEGENALVGRAEDGAEMMGIFCPKMNGYQSWVRAGTAGSSWGTSGCLHLSVRNFIQLPCKKMAPKKIKESTAASSGTLQVGVWQGSICQPLWHAYGSRPSEDPKTVPSSSPIITSPLMGAQTSNARCDGCHSWDQNPR